MGTTNSNDHEAKLATPATPSAETMAMINQAVAAAVSGIFQQMAPIFKDMALTPEKLREANKPWIDPAKIAREARESQNSREQEAQLRKEIVWRQNNCAHLDRNGMDSISLMRNNLDGQPKGICVLCHAIIEGRVWKIGTPQSHPDRPDHAYLSEPHKDFHRVMRIFSMAG